MVWCDGLEDVAEYHINMHLQIHVQKKLLPIARLKFLCNARVIASLFQFSA